MSNPIIRTRETYNNTFKMMGLTGRDLITVVDGIFTLRNLINPMVQKSIIRDIGAVVVLGKTFKDWHIHYVKAAVKAGNKAPNFDTDGRAIKLDVRDFRYENITGAGMHCMVDLLLQEYYAKEYLQVSN
jgi:hypothetical protein